ncbi:MAG: hypothetical protein ACE37N_07145 [Pseudohongiellaceae bacterium]
MNTNRAVWYRAQVVAAVNDIASSAGLFWWLMTEHCRAGVTLIWQTNPCRAGNQRSQVAVSTGSDR